VDLTHSFTVPAAVDDAWATFMDLEQVGACFPGATVTSATDDGFEGTVKVKLGPIALVYAGSGTFTERDDTAHRAVIEAKGKDKRGNGTAGATVTIQLAEAVQVRFTLLLRGRKQAPDVGLLEGVANRSIGQRAFHGDQTHQEVVRLVLEAEVHRHRALRASDVAGHLEGEAGLSHAGHSGQQHQLTVTDPSADHLVQRHEAGLPE